MTWSDILVDRAMRLDDVVRGVAYMFDVSPTDVRASDDPATIEAARVTCLVRPVDGDFATVLEVYVHDPTLVNRQVVPALERFVTRMKCSCLVGDDSANPYSWVLVDSAGNHKRVLLDPEELERDRYVLRRREH